MSSHGHPGEGPLSIPVGDADRVVEEATEEETVTTLFRTGGIVTVLEHLQTVVAEERGPTADGDEPEE